MSSKFNILAADRVALNKLVVCLKMLRDLREDIPIQATLMLLLIAARSRGVTSKEAGDYLHLSQPAVHRNATMLSEEPYTNHGKTIPGLGLIAKEEDPYERRRKLYTLTPKGFRFITTLAETISGGSRI